VHKVRRGETLSSIARRYRVSVEDLRRMNAIGSRGTIQAGDRLVVSGGRRSSSASSSSGTGPSVSASSKTKARASAPAARSTQYKVRQGDTLYRIASR